MNLIKLKNFFINSKPFFKSLLYVSAFSAITYVLNYYSDFSVNLLYNKLMSLIIIPTIIGLVFFIVYFTYFFNKFDLKIVKNTKTQNLKKSTRLLGNIVVFWGILLVSFFTGLGLFCFPTNLLLSFALDGRYLFIPPAFIPIIFVILNYKYSKDIELGNEEPINIVKDYLGFTLYMISSFNVEKK